MMEKIYLDSVIKKYISLCQSDYKNKEEFDMLKRVISMELKNKESIPFTINDLTFVCSNDVGRYFARKISFDSDCFFNRYIDKPIIVMIDDNLESKDFSFSDEGKFIIANIGIASDVKMNKSSFISKNPVIREAFINEQLISDIRFYFNKFDSISGFANFSNLLSSLLDDFEDSIVGDLSADKIVEDALSTEEFFELSFNFLNKVDKSGRLSRTLKDVIESGNLILLKTDEEIKAASEEFDCTIMRGYSLYDGEHKKIILPCNNTTDDFLAFIHEFMHHYSYIHASKISYDDVNFFFEFPSIYFEFLADEYALDNGRKTNYVIGRNADVINSFRDIAFFVDLYKLFLNDKLDSTSLLQVAEKYNISWDDLCNLITNEMYNIFELCSYFLGLLTTKYCLSNGIEPSLIQDISEHLFDLSFEEIIDKLNMNGYLLKDYKKDSVSVGK